MVFTLRITNSHARPVPNSRTPAVMKSTAVHLNSSENFIASSGMSKRVVTAVIIPISLLFSKVIFCLSSVTSSDDRAKGDVEQAEACRHHYVSVAGRQDKCDCTECDKAPAHYRYRTNGKRSAADDSCSIAKHPHRDHRFENAVSIHSDGDRNACNEGRQEAHRKFACRDR